MLTDHKPLTHLFGETRGIPTLASARVQRWALILSGYDYSIKYRSGKELCNADGCSRLPLPDYPPTIPVPAETVLLLECLQQSPISFVQIQKWTARDPCLSRVCHYAMQGWPAVVDTELIPYFRRREEISVQGGCLLWGSRIIVPSPARTQILQLLHETHPGIQRMKSIARSYVWWPGLDGELENQVRACPSCQAFHRSPQKSPLHPWDWPEKVWSRVHIDFAGPFLGSHYFLLVDARSKWLEVHPVNSTSTHAALSKLRHVFSIFGLPDVLVSDNASAFTSEEFQQFVKRNGIRHVTSSPHHPATNGLVERAVQSFKQAMRKSTSPLDIRLHNFLFSYRLTPHSTTGQAPVELMMNRRPKSLLDLLRPDMRSQVCRQQERQKRNHDKTTKERKFNIGDPVLTKNFGSGSPRWLRGHVSRCNSPLSLLITLEDGRCFRCHVDHVLACPQFTRSEQDEYTSPVPIVTTDDISDSPSSTSEATVPAARDLPSAVPTSGDNISTTVVPSSIPRRSLRTRRPPNRFSPEKGGRKV